MVLGYRIPSPVEVGAQAANIVTLTDSTGLSGSHDNTLAATAALVTLTDSSGYSGTHDDTIAATAAITTLTDSTGLSGTHNDTLEAVTTFTPSVAWDGAAVFPSAADATAIGAAITALNQNASDTAQKVIELVARDLVHAQNISDLTQKVIEVVAQLAVATQNISDIGQKVIEMLAGQKSVGLMAADS